MRILPPPPAAVPGPHGAPAPWLRTALALGLACWGALLLLLLPAVPARAQAQAPAGRLAVPRQQGAVTDTTGTLTAGQVHALREKIAQLHDMPAANAPGGKGPTLVVLLVPSTAPEAIEPFATRVFDAWKPGTAQDDNGLLLLVAMQDRRMRIEVGQGLEGVVPDLAANRIIEEQMRPRLRQQDFYGGIDAAVDALAGLVGSATAATVSVDSDGPGVTVEEVDVPPRDWTGGEKALAAGLGLVGLLVLAFVGRFVLRNMRTIYRRSRAEFVARSLVASMVIVVAAVACEGDWAPAGLVTFFTLLFCFVPSVRSGGRGGDSSGGAVWSSSSDSSSSSSSSDSSSSSSSSDSGGSSSGGGSSGDW